MTPYKKIQIYNNKALNLSNYSGISVNLLKLSGTLVGKLLDQHQGNTNKTGRETTALAELLGLLTDKHVGSRKTHRSILPAFDKVLCNNLVQARILSTMMIFGE